MINSVTINYSGDYDKQLDMMIRNFFATIGVEVLYNNQDHSDEKVSSVLVAKTIIAFLYCPYRIEANHNSQHYYSLSTLKSRDWDNKIGAIKFLRVITGCGLKEAKDLVEIFRSNGNTDKLQELTFMRKVKAHLENLSPTEALHAVKLCNNIISITKDS